MHGDNDPTLVLGEALESDDECCFEEIAVANITVEQTPEIAKASVVGSAVTGEAIESDEEVVFHNTTPTELKSSPINPPMMEKQLSQSVKKLYKKNRELGNSLASFKKQIFTSTKYELNNVNQQLLKSQIELQQTLMHLRVIKTNLIDYQIKLDHIIVANYIPVISINVPPHII